MQITQQLTAWMVAGSPLGPDDFKCPGSMNLGSLTYSDGRLDMTKAGWTRIGTATVTLELPSVNAVIEAKVGALRAEITQTRAEAEAKVNYIESQISNLLAIEYTPVEA